MGILRIHRIKKLAALKSRNASTLVESLVAMAIVGVVSLMLAEGVMVSVGFYQRGNDLRDEAEAAYQALLKSSDGALQDGVTSQTYLPEHKFDETQMNIDVYSYSLSDGNVILYYYSSSN